MQRYKTIIYILLWILFITYTFVAFPLLNDNVMFPVLLLVMLGGWLYGLPAGYFFAGLATVYLYIHYQFFADRYNSFQNRLLGPTLSLFLVYFTGTLKENLVKIKAANRKLDDAVRKRTSELQRMAAHLIEESEKFRSALGRELHDGIGQQMTGSLLYMSAISDTLESEQHPCTPTAKDLHTRVQQTHNLIRKTSRLLFPIRINDVGLYSALEELASTIEKTRNVEFSVQMHGWLQEIPASTALHIYRICHELTLCLINHSSVSSLSINLSATATVLHLSVEHNGSSIDEQIKDFDELRLMQYRLMEIQGRMRVVITETQSECFHFTIPAYTTAHTSRKPAEENQFTDSQTTVQT